MPKTPLRAIVVVADVHEASRLLNRLNEWEFATKVISNTCEALHECRRNPPDLAIVEKKVDSMGGIRFLAELLKISWTTSAILISDEDGDALLQEAEGLGILGGVRHSDDIDGLETLINRFLEMVSPTQRSICRSSRDDS